MKLLITGSEGFIAKNLIVRLSERPDLQALAFSRRTPAADLARLAREADAVVHLAGVNRPVTRDEFVSGNVDLTRALCDALIQGGRKVPVVFASSVQAVLDNDYGRSKREAESVLRRYAAQTGAAVYIYRLPNVFGKWCKPQYNSAVATFCHHVARGLPIRIDDASASLTLAYIDDVVEEFLRVLTERPLASPEAVGSVPVQYQTTVGEVAAAIQSFRDGRATLMTERVGTGLLRALYSTFVSYLPPAEFSYPVPMHRDARGVFVEMLKTRDSGQLSFFTAHPGVTRGGHYHHSKTEKFLVIQGKARFCFRHLLTHETHTLSVSGERPEIVESIPGWAHDITNVGEEELIVMLWANEVFDRSRPDTIASRVEQ